jgi:hypothetical protein
LPLQELKNQNTNKRKAFLDTEKVIVAYNHGAFFCYLNSTSNGKCEKWPSPNHLSYTHHYRNSLLKKQNNETFTNTRMWRFKDELMKAVNFTLEETNFKT